MDTRIMTYAELGELLGIKTASAKKLAQRKRWPRIPGNDGMARVTVTLSDLPESSKPTKDIPEDIPEAVPAIVPDPVIMELSVTVARLEERIDGLNSLLDAERRRAATAEDTAEHWRMDADHWRQQSERAAIPAPAPDPGPSPRLLRRLIRRAG